MSKMGAILEGLSLGRVNESSIDSLVKDLNSLPVVKGPSKANSTETYEMANKYAEVLDKFPIGTVLSHKMDAGVEKFEKIEKGYWNHTRAPWRDTVQKNSSWDLGKWLFVRGAITRGPIEISKD